MNCYTCKRYPTVKTIKGRSFCSRCASKVKTCLYCEYPFSTPYPSRLYCTPWCEQEHIKKERAEQLLAPKNCAWCDQVFKPGQKQQKYCSKQCSKLATLDRAAKKLSTREKGRLLILDRDGFQCAYCGRTSYKDRVELHVDHITPLSKGGTNHARNLVTSCLDCNLEKTNRILYSASQIRLEVQRRNELAGVDPEQLIDLLGYSSEKESLT